MPHRRTSLSLAGLFCALLLCVGCTELTEIMVVIDSDLIIPRELDAVGVRVVYQDRDASSVVAENTWEVDLNRPNAIKLPASIGLLPGNDPGRPILVVVTGYQAGTKVIDRQARLSFAEGRVLLLKMTLLRSCLYKVCPEGETCGENGCEPIDKDVSKLPEYVPGKILPGVGDARSDIAVDAGVDVKVDGNGDMATDAVVPDAPLDAPQPDAPQPDLTPWPDLMPWPDLVPWPDLTPWPDSCVAPVGWWSVAYAFRQPLTVAESIPGSLSAGYSVVAMLDTQALVSANKMLASGADLRVVRYVAGSHVELDRRIVGMGTAQTEVWFKTQDVVNSADATYYLYYGSPTAGSPPAHWSDSMGASATASKVYLAADDFEDDTAGGQPNGWEGSSKYTVEQVGSNKVLKVTGTNPNADYFFAGDYSWTDVVVQARLRVLLTSGDHYGLFTRAESPSNFDTLFFGLENNSRLALYTCNLSDAAATGLTSSYKGQWSLNPSAGTSWHVIEVRLLGQQATLHWDGVQKGTHNIAANQMQQGRIGLCAGYPAAQAYWDDVVVRSYVDPEPSVTPSAEESGCP